VVFEQDWHDTAGSLTLDTLGNWDAMRMDPDGDDTPASMTTTTRGHNLANEYTSKDEGAYYDHDDDGNLLDDGTYIFAYDYANHLVKVTRKSDSTVIAQYAYDALGRRAKKIVADVSDTLDGTTLYYYDGLRVVERGQLEESGNYVASHQHVWGLYLDEQLVYDYDADGDGNFDAIDQQGGDKRYYVTHAFLYSASAVIDATGSVLERYDYEPYGTPSLWSGDYADTRSQTTLTSIFLFTGQLYDPETGLYHYKARAHHRTIGRFLQRDPAGPGGAAGGYEYARGVPCAALDSLGEQPTTRPGGPRTRPVAPPFDAIEYDGQPVFGPAFSAKIKYTPGKGSQGYSYVVQTITHQFNAWTTRPQKRGMAVLRAKRVGQDVFALTPGKQFPDSLDSNIPIRAYLALAGSYGNVCRFTVYMQEAVVTLHTKLKVKSLEPDKGPKTWVDYVPADHKPLPGHSSLIGYTSHVNVYMPKIKLWTIFKKGTGLQVKGIGRSVVGARRKVYVEIEELEQGKNLMRAYVKWTAPAGTNLKGLNLVYVGPYPMDPSKLKPLP